MTLYIVYGAPFLVKGWWLTPASACLVAGKDANAGTLGAYVTHLPVVIVEICLHIWTMDLSVVSPPFWATYFSG